MTARWAVCRVKRDLDFNRTQTAVDVTYDDYDSAEDIRDHRRETQPLPSGETWDVYPVDAKGRLLDLNGPAAAEAYDRARHESGIDN